VFLSSTSWNNWIALNGKVVLNQAGVWLVVLTSFGMRQPVIWAIS